MKRGYFQSDAIVRTLAEMMGPPPELEARGPDPDPYEKGWRPALNPMQKLAYESDCIYKLTYGERGSGKTIGCLHEVVEDAYLTRDCLNYVGIKEVGMATQGGAWDKLLRIVLPEWKEENRLQHTDSRLDAQTKNPYIWLRNKWNGWSQIMLVSLPVAAQVDIKIRGREPHCIFFDEAQGLDGDGYFSNPLMQLGRRYGTADRPSKLIYACNPEGPEHWLYKRFFKEPVDSETGEWDKRYAHFHIPIHENLHNLPPNYYENYVKPAVKNDPVLEARLVRGEWVDRMDGDALFSGQFSETIHVRGNYLDGKGILPVKLASVPVIISWDPGAVHSVIVMCQIIPSLHKILKLVFDEFDYVGQHMAYTKLVPLLIARQMYWEKKMDFKFNWIHVADSSAFNQYRAASGSFDSWDIEKISQKYIEEQKEKLDRLAKERSEKIHQPVDKKVIDQAKADLDRFVIKMRAAPKGEHSIEARVRMLKEDLITESILFSAMCIRIKEMFLRLLQDPEDSMKPKKKARYGHNLDALTYGFFWAQHKQLLPGSRSGDVTPTSYSI